MAIEKKVNRLAKDIHLSLLAEGRPVSVTVRGGSMYPFLKSGDRIKIRPVEESKIKIGDIVAIQTKGETEAWFIIHRVVKIVAKDKKRLYFTKGDAVKEAPPEAVCKESIAGRINAIERQGLKINLERLFWPYVNMVVAKLSLGHPRVIAALSRYLDWIIEWRALPFRIKRRLKRGGS